MLCKLNSARQENTKYEIKWYVSYYWKTTILASILTSRHGCREIVGKLDKISQEKKMFVGASLLDVSYVITKKFHNYTPMTIGCSF